MHKKLFSKAMIFIFIMIALGACSKTSALEMGDTAPDFSLPGIDGKAASLSESKGKVIILDFFASWCPPCKQEIPDFVELQKTYGENGFTMIGVSNESIKDSKSFVSKMSINYPVLVDDGKVNALYGPIRSIPTTFVIGRDFKVAKMYIGYRPKDVFEKDIKELI